MLIEGVHAKCTCQLGLCVPFGSKCESCDKTYTALVVEHKAKFAGMIKDEQDKEKQAKDETAKKQKTSTSSSSSTTVGNWTRGSAMVDENSMSKALVAVVDNHCLQHFTNDPDLWTNEEVTNVGVTRYSVGSQC